MSDGDSIVGSVADTVKDLGKETVKQVVGSASSGLKSAEQQISASPNSAAKEEQKKAEQMITFQRIKEIEAEMAQIRAQNEKKTGPEIISKHAQGLDEVDNNKPQTLDEASRQAVGRAEQGRNFKG